MTRTKIIRMLILSFVIIAVLATTVWRNRRMLVLRIEGLVQGTPSLSEPSTELESVTWFDDYFTIEFVDSETIAIGEPRYYQQNYNYLILGRDRAILFDSGPGVRDIKPVVDSLTSLPVTVVSSHLHFDHVGNHTKFDRIALVDLPDLRKRTQSGVFRPLPEEHLGFIDEIELPYLNVSEWWALGQQVDLGIRTLTVINVPGHTSESIVLLDEDRGLLFTGDFIYDGSLLAIMPNSNLSDYLHSTRKLLDIIPTDTRLLTAHRASLSGAPILEYTNLVDLQSTLEQVIGGTLEGDGFYMKSYYINSALRLIAEEP